LISTETLIYLSAKAIRVRTVREGAEGLSPKEKGAHRARLDNKERHYEEMA
jgi:hypothetical protein